MDIYLNELSFYPFTTNDTELIERLQLFVKQIKNLHDILGSALQVRTDESIASIPVSDKSFLIDFLKRKRCSFSDYLFQCFKRPYIPEGQQYNVLIQKAQNSFAVILKDGKRKDCVGLGYAFLAESFSIGFYSETFWDKITHEIIQVDEQLNENKFNVLCVSKLEHHTHSDFIDFIEKKSVSNIPISKLKPEKKAIPTFGNHHGNNQLKEFAKRLVDSPYVEQIISSEHFFRGYKSFIKEICPNGRILLVLTWFSEGYSLWVQTTGKNKPQTEAIAKILEKRYSK